MVVVVVVVVVVESFFSPLFSFLLGSPLLVPEETKVSYELAIEQGKTFLFFYSLLFLSIYQFCSGAGYIECDASYTKDGVFVCRHNVCDLQTTTNILANHSDLAEKCSVPFVPGQEGGRRRRGPLILVEFFGLFESVLIAFFFTATPPFKKAQVKCCTYDFTLRV